MAAICPNCHHPEAIAYLVNDEGIHPFPCLECNYGTTHSRHQVILSGAAACGTAGCHGSVADEYTYNAKGRLIRLSRQRCRLCGGHQTREVSYARSPAKRPVPDPRL
ncbi:hypothetical protein AB0O01_03400 [Streptomyces sp. NPDC093252]|uniref:hypothetical protein n=1 Tax=Streptomyces sp. NPDC093252 TaxID=3154980 RepID=UPI0034141CA6